MNTKNILSILSSIPLLLASVAHATVITHYDIDFSAPTHTVGAAPSAGTGSDSPSSIVFGQPRVENGFNALAGDSLVFNTSGNTNLCCFYDQIELDLAAGYDNYQLSFDMAAESLANAQSNNIFRVFFDTPHVRTLSFLNNGNIGIHQPGSISGELGSFDNDTLYRVLIDINLATSMWYINIDDVFAFASTFTTTGDDIDSVRFSYGLASGDSSSSHDNVGIDNILLTSRGIGPTTTVPAPATLALFALGLMGLFASKCLRS